jgi:hypothetical protein
MQAQTMIRKGNALLARGDYALLARKSFEVAVRAGYRVAGLGLRNVRNRGTLSFIGCRDELGLILNARELTGEGVEVGVLRGDHSVDLLQRWAGKCLHSVDPWRPFSPEVYRDNDNRDKDEQEQLYQETCAKLSGFGSRSNVLRMTSAEAAVLFRPGQLDFVYIDAQHHYEAVKEDIELWYPKLTRGGILAGHDYLDGSLSNGEFGVKRAVDEFARTLNKKVYTSREPDYPSWFIEF